MSNSNFNITKVTVDPTSQEITNLEVNGKSFESGGGSELEAVTFDENNPLNVGNLFAYKPDAVRIFPSEGYDGIDQINIIPGGLIGYPGEDLEIKEDQSTTVAETFTDEVTITIPDGEAWTGTVTITKA